MSNLVQAAMDKATQVLGDKQKARLWLDTPNLALGGRSPIEMLDSQESLLQILAVLDRIEYGIYE